MANTNRKTKAAKEVTPGVSSGKNNLYPIEDRDIIEYLMKLTHPTKEELELIFSMYKKYINPKHTTYNVGCNCSNDIRTLYWDLIGFYSQNKQLWAGNI